MFVRVLIVEDSDFIADALGQLIALLPDLTIAGRATNRDTALAAVAASPPDLCILDLRIKDRPDGAPAPEHGLAVLQAMQRLARDTHVLVFSSLPERPWLRVAAQAGAVGFVSKDSSSSELVAALRAVIAGMVVFTPAQLQLLQQPAIEISRREREVLFLLAAGATNQEIAERLAISVGTVRKHVENMGALFGVHNRSQIVAAARRERLLPSDI
jgi:DNA-binding NarL/FixJ family response regulator